MAVAALSSPQASTSTALDVRAIDARLLRPRQPAATATRLYLKLHLPGVAIRRRCELSSLRLGTAMPARVTVRVVRARGRSCSLALPCEKAGSPFTPAKHDSSRFIYLGEFSLPISHLPTLSCVVVIQRDAGSQLLLPSQSASCSCGERWLRCRENAQWTTRAGAIEVASAESKAAPAGTQIPFCLSSALGVRHSSL